MRNRIALLLLFFAMSSLNASEPGIDVEAAVTRYSEFELTEAQAAILDEATKVSTAARVFHGLYGRWPNDVQELATRTVGIDFTIFDGKVLIDIVKDGLLVTVFDGKDVRRLLAKSELPVSPRTKELAQDSDFRIRVRLRSTPPGVTQ